ncbi:MAG: bifunctional pyr operon transcriptional regulator/uracil phosphoribosyltransferase PyrR [Planctomycetota bacterium]|jgi:pyrimidine operon attenuation protein/uracil phosphoribosyltransferase
MAEAEKRIGNEEDIRSFIDRVASEVHGACPAPASLGVIGIRSRGQHLARRLCERVSALCGGAEIPLGVLDITLYRDDLHEVAQQPVVRETDLPFDVTGRFLVLVDDVIFTGRTVRAAIDQIIDFGRPRVIKLAALVDRGSRELPIQPDFVGKSMKLEPRQDVQVRLREADGKDEVVLIENDKRTKSA